MRVDVVRSLDRRRQASAPARIPVTPVVPASVPAAISGLVAAWYVESLAGANDGTEVTAWAASEGTAAGLSAISGNVASVAGRPTYQSAAVGGKAGVRFPAASSYLEVPVANAAPVRLAQPTVFAVVRDAAGTASFRMAVECPPSGTAHAFPYHRYSLQIGNTGTFRTEYAGASAQSAVVPGTTAYKCVVLDLAGGSFRVNGAAAASGTAGLSATYTGNEPLRFGANGGGGETWVGDIAAVLVYNRQLTGAEITQVEAWLTARYGVA